MSRVKKMTRRDFKAIYRTARILANHDRQLPRHDAWYLACHIHGWNNWDSLSVVMYRWPVGSWPIEVRLSEYKSRKSVEVEDVSVSLATYLDSKWVAELLREV